MGVYAALFGIGKIVFAEMTNGLILSVIAIACFPWIARSFRNDAPPPTLRAYEPEAQAAAD